MLPLLSPGSVAEIVELGLHAVAMSRAAGLWTAMKIVSDVADTSAVVRLRDPGELEIPLPPAESRGGPPVLLGLSSVAAEHDLMSRRLDLARDYGRRHGLNRVVFEPDRPRTALVAPGPAFATLRRALSQLGIGDAELEQLGVRLVKLGLVWPLHPDDVRAFAAGVDELIVVEDKRPFVERQLRDLLYGVSDPPRVLGKRDADGRELIALSGTVDADQVARALARLFGDRLPEHCAERVAGARERVRAGAQLPPLPIARTPFFCSGCPHNLSTRTPADQLVGAGIGCHSLIWVDRPGRRGQILGAPQMGGEGAQWLGHGAVHRRPPLRPEHGRRHLPSLGLAGDPSRRRRRQPDHVPAALQRRDRDDRRSGGARPDGRSRAHALAADRGRQAGDHHDRGRRLVRRRGARAGRLGARPRAAPGRADRARARRRGHGPDPHRPLRDRGAAPAQAGQAADAGPARVDQRARVRGLRRLRRQVQLPVGRPGRDRVRAQDPDPPVVLHPGPGLPGRRLPELRRRHAGGARRDAGAGAGDAAAARAAARAGLPVRRRCSTWSCGCRGSAAPAS